MNKFLDIPIFPTNRPAQQLPPTRLRGAAYLATYTGVLRDESVYIEITYARLPEPPEKVYSIRTHFQVKGDPIVIENTHNFPQGEVFLTAIKKAEEVITMLRERRKTEKLLGVVL